MEIYTTKMEGYNYEGGEDDTDFQARIQIQLNKRGWFVDYDVEQIYFIVSCSALDFEWIHAISEVEYCRTGFYRNGYPIKKALDSLKKKMTFFHSMEKDMDIESTKKEYDYYVKNRYKIASLLVAYKLIDIPI